MANEAYFPSIPETDKVKDSQYIIINNEKTGKPDKTRLDKFLTNLGVVTTTTLPDLLPETYIEATYTEAEALVNSCSLVPGTHYKITDKADLGIMLLAVTPCQFSLEGQGIFLNPDFQATGVYSNTPIAHTSTEGVWYKDGEKNANVAFNAIALPAGNGYPDGSYVNIDLIPGTGTGTGLKADITVVGGQITAFTVVDFGVGYNVGETVTPDLGAPFVPILLTISSITPSSYVNGSVVFFNGLHYQITDASAFDGTNPATNVTSYTLLTKATANVGYIEEVDFILYDFANDTIIQRSDKRGNIVKNQGAIIQFQWGNNFVIYNEISTSGYLDCINQKGYIEGNIVNMGYVLIDNRNRGSISYNVLNTISTVLNKNAGLSFGSNIVDFQGYSGLGINIIFINNINETSEILNSKGSTFKANLDMTSDFGAGVLTIPVDYNYIGIFTCINSSETISEIINLPLHKVRFYSEIGESQLFSHKTIATASANELVSDAAAINTITGRTNGSDFIEYEKSGTLNRRYNAVILA